MFAVTGIRSRSAFTNPVRQPAVEECLIGGPALGEAQVALALERLERAQQHGLAAARPRNARKASSAASVAAPIRPSGIRSG